MQNKFRKLNDKARFHLDQLMQEIHIASYSEGYEVAKALYTNESIEGARPLTVIFNEMPDNIPVLTPNQQRAELIQKAKKFVDRTIYEHRQLAGLTGDEISFKYRFLNLEFIVNTDKRVVVAILKDPHSKKVVYKGKAKCMHDEVFNESIGKAIALAKLLQIDIPVEFLEAVQPTKKAYGMDVVYEETGLTYSLISTGEVLEDGCAHISSPVGRNGIIIDDTNAQYEIPS